MANITVRVRQTRHPGTLFTIPGPHPGLVVPGNLNLWARPVIRNPNGSYSTVRSTSYRLEDGPYVVDGRHYPTLEVLVPSAYGGKTDFSKWGPLRHYQATHQHLGIFDNAAHATVYGDRLHLWFVQNAKWFVPPKK